MSIFRWTIPLFYIGTKRKIHLTDLYKTLFTDKSETVGDQLERNWAKEVKRAAEKPHIKPSLLKALVKTFFWDYSIYGLFFAVHTIFLR